MAFDFPASPTDGQVYSPSGGPTYVWKAATTTWELQTAGSLYVLKTGDTMTGSLVVNKANPDILLQKTGTTQQAVLWGTSPTTGARWTVVLGNATAEAAGNVGSDFGVGRYDNTGAYIDTPLMITRSDGHITLNSELWIAKASNPVIRFYQGASTMYQWFNGTTMMISGGSLYLDQAGATVHSAIGQFDSYVSTGNITASGTVYGGSAAGCKSAYYIDSTGAGNNPQLVFRDQANSVAGQLYWDRSVDELGWLHYSGVKLRVGSWGVASSHTDCYKPTGGPWITGSDSRIKTVTGRYESGLAEVLKLEPVTYTYKGNDSLVGTNIDTAKENIGLVAQMVEPVMPEMVNQISGSIDGKEVVDLRTLDTGPLIYALVNAVKTLTARIEQLEGKLDAPSKPTTAKSDVRSGTGKVDTRNTKKGRKRVHPKRSGRKTAFD